MKSKITISVLAASLFIVSQVVHGDDTGTNPVKHPVVAYDEHQVKTNEKDIQKDETKMIETHTSMKERKAFVEQNKADYEKALKNYGANHDITKQAKARYEEAQKNYDTSARMHHKAGHAMHKDQRELQHAQQELKEDRAEAAK